MGSMNRALVAIVTIVACLAAGASPAAARTTELGNVLTGTGMTPSCPSSPCLAVTKTTGYQFTAGTRRTIFIAPRTGRVVAFTLKLGRPSARQIEFFNQQAGGTAKARIAILRPARGSRSNEYKFLLNAQSEDYNLQQHFGRTVQFPLRTSLLARQGWVVALSVPTWAPVLAVNGLDNTFAWRASRVRPCSTNPESQPPHLAPGTVKQYFCTYRPARLTYTATLISTP